MSVKITVEGISNAQNFLKKEEKNTDKAIQEAMNLIGIFMQGEVKASIAGRRAEPTSVDTGRFLNSVDFEANKDSVTIFSDVPYAKGLEFGTTRLNPRRHFNNSKDRNKNKVAELINSQIKKSI